MTTVRKAVLGIAALLILGVPRVASAGAGDLIWGLSGPQFIGAVSECDFVLTASQPVCRVFGKRLSGADADDPLVFQAGGPRRIWLTLDGTFYVSTGKNKEGPNSEDIDYRGFHYFMVAFEPLVQVQSFQVGRATFYHGVLGLSYDILFGKGFDAFDNVGIKIRPVGITAGRFDFAYNLRIYPRGFAPSDFGFEVAKARPDAETVHGISVGVRW
jgi:hypothetical protein